ADGVSAEQAGMRAPALRIELEMGGKSLRVMLGAAAPAPAGARYAAVETAGVTKLFVVSQGVVSELSVPFEKFRETRLLEYGRRDFAKLAFERGGEKFELEQRPHDAFFFHGKNTSELCNRDVTEKILTALSRLSTETFMETEQARAALAQD